MTNEDIHELALEAVEEGGAFDYRRTGDGELKVADPQVLRAVQSVLHKAVSQAYGDVLLLNVPQREHLGTGLSDAWYQAGFEAAKAEYMNAARALKDSLAEKTETASR